MNTSLMIGVVQTCPSSRQLLITLLGQMLDTLGKQRLGSPSNLDLSHSQATQLLHTPSQTLMCEMG